METLAIRRLSAAGVDYCQERNLCPDGTEFHGSAWVGIGPLLLAVPIQLEATALGINCVEYLDSGFTPNPWRHRFGMQHEKHFYKPHF